MAASKQALRRFEALDGLRAISILWMISFHTLWCVGFKMAPEDFRQLLESPWLRPLAKGYFGVDIFFVLSGFLIGRLLMDEFKSEGRIDLGRFYTRRFLRIVPAYLVLLVVAFPVPELDPTTSWTNVLGFNNFVPYKHQFLPWTWSLAIEEQFYLIIPLALLGVLYGLKRPRIQLMLYIAALGLGVILLLALLRTSGINTLPPYHPHLGLDKFERYFDLIYDKPYTRYSGLLCGVIVAHLFTFHGLRNFFKKRPGLTQGGLWVCLLLLGLTMLEPPANGGAVQLYLSLERTTFSMLVAYVLAYAICAPPAGLLPRLLSAKPWKPLAKLSYGAYLFHPLAILILYATLLKSLPKNPLTMWGCVPFMWAVSFVIASGSYHWIENPARKLGKLGS